FELDDFRRVTGPLSDPHDTGETRSPVRVLWRDLVEQLVDHERLVRKLREHRPASGEVAALGERDDALDLPAARRRLGFRRAHLPVATDGHGQVLKLLHPGSALA